MNVFNSKDLIIFEDIKLLIHKVDENSINKGYRTTIIEPNMPCIILGVTMSQRNKSPFDIRLLTFDGRTGTVFSSEEDIKILISP